MTTDATWTSSLVGKVSFLRAPPFNVASCAEKATQLKRCSSAPTTLITRARSPPNKRAAAHYDAGRGGGGTLPSPWPGGRVVRSPTLLDHAVVKGAPRHQTHCPPPILGRSRPGDLIGLPVLMNYGCAHGVYGQRRRGV